MHGLLHSLSVCLARMLHLENIPLHSRTATEQWREKASSQVAEHRRHRTILRSSLGFQITKELQSQLQSFLGLLHIIAIRNLHSYEPSKCNCLRDELASNFVRDLSLQFLASERCLGSSDRLVTRACVRIEREKHP